MLTEEKWLIRTAQGVTPPGPSLFHMEYQEVPPCTGLNHRGPAYPLQSCFEYFPGRRTMWNANPRRSRPAFHIIAPIKAFGWGHSRRPPSRTQDTDLYTSLDRKSL